MEKKTYQIFNKGNEENIGFSRSNENNIFNKGKRYQGRERTNRRTEGPSSSSGFVLSKGMSPLISSVLLIAIAVTIAGMIFNWVPVLTRGQQSQISNKSSEIVECNPPIIEEVYLDFTAIKASVFVRGGTGNAAVFSAKLLNRQGDEVPLVNASSVPFNITKGDLKKLEFNMSGKLTSCSNFSQAIISSCIVDRFDSAPKCS